MAGVPVGSRGGPHHWGPLVSFHTVTSLHLFLRGYSQPFGTTSTGMNGLSMTAETEPP